MGRIQDSSGAKMTGKQRAMSDASDAYTSSKKRRHEKSSRETSHAGGVEATPPKDRRTWTQSEELALLRVLLDHKREGRVIPMQSKAAPYWSELITLVYPGEKGITQRRLYDKVRRMHQKYNEGKDVPHDGKKNAWKNAHEKTLYDFWVKIFGDEDYTSAQEQGAKAVKGSNGNAVKVVHVSESSSEEEEEDDNEEEQEEEEEVPVAKPTLKAQPSYESEEDEDDEEEDEEDDQDEDSSPEKPMPLHSGQVSTRAEGSRILREELRRVTSVSGGENQRGGVKASSKQSGGSGRKEKFAVKGRFNDEANVVVKKQRGRGGDQSLPDADFVRSLKAELFEYVQKLRDDCMRELDDVKSQVLSPARLQMARRRQELFLEELALQEKELEISRRYCRLQKEALQFQTGN